LIAGGGKLADAIRAVDDRCGLGEELAHWRCIDALSETARQLASILPEAVLEQARRVLREEFPELNERIALHMPDEKSRRVGQAVGRPAEIAGAVVLMALGVSFPWWWPEVQDQTTPA
jgi:hypothetical protein